jgi:RNase P/RNase MRP subunit p29
MHDRRIVIRLSDHDEWRWPMPQGKQLLSGIIVSVVLGLTVLVVHAQSKDSRGTTGTTITATGCLARSDSPDFHLISDDGKRYELRSDSVPLADHVGHKVTVKGTVMEESQADDKDKNEARKIKAATLQVTDLQMVSSSCK